MIRPSLLFLIVALVPGLEWLVNYLRQQLAFSVTPGWHAIIYPPFYFILLGQLLWLCLLPLFYFLLERNGRQLPKSILLLHLFLTLTYFVSAPLGNTYPLTSFSEMLNWLLLALFLVGSSSSFGLLLNEAQVGSAGLFFVS